jgi:hypothetical protein
VWALSAPAAMFRVIKTHQRGKRRTITRSTSRRRSRTVSRDFNRKALLRGGNARNADDFAAF